jgi:hypothetical protein
MLILLSVMPIVALKTQYISVGARKNLALFIVNLVIRML